MSSPKFAETHNVIAFLEKPVESNGFAEIIDFLKASSIHYALTVNPIIYTSCIEQFWATAKVQTVNGVRQLQALVDKKRVIITESSIRSDLSLDDAEGTDYLPTATIFEELACMRYEKPSQKLTFYKAFFSPQWKYFIHTITQFLSANSTAWNEFSSTMASLIIYLATNKKFNLSKYIFDAMVKHLDGGVKFMMYPHFLQVFINQQLGDMSHHKKIFINLFHIKKIFANMKRAGKDFSGRITPLFDTMMVQASEEQKQKSKRRQRKEAEVPRDETEHEESVPIPFNDPQPSGEGRMQLNDLMVLCTKLQAQRLERKKKSGTIGLKRLKKVGMFRRVESSKDQESLGDHEDASKQGRSIEDIDADTKVTLVNETQERRDDDLMFDTRVLDDDEVFMDVITVEKEEQSTKTDEAVTTAGVGDSAAPTIPTTIKETLARTLMEIKAAKPKAKGIVFHDQEEHVSVFKPTVSVTQPSVKDKGKEEERLERQKQEEANIALIESWENTQAMIEADRLLAERLQTREREELTAEEKGKLFMELIEKRRKHFAELRAQ
ncbi:hypothetical protein Tco_0331189 [Tanacetum coccineum]